MQTLIMFKYFSKPQNKNQLLFKTHTFLQIFVSDFTIKRSLELLPDSYVPTNPLLLVQQVSNNTLCVHLSCMACSVV